jgi:hypothetical protein
MAWSQPVPVETELQVNSDTEDYVLSVVASSDVAGNFVVVWGSSPTVDYCICFPKLRGQRFDREGRPLGSNFDVSSRGSEAQEEPSICHDAAGNFTVVWADAGADGDGSGIVGRRFDARGVPRGPDFMINSTTLGNQYDPDVACDAAGGFAVAWQDRNGLDGDQWGVFGQLFDRNARPVGGEFQVNTYTTGFQLEPEVASDPSGDFTVVWTSVGQITQPGFIFPYDVFGQRYDHKGQPMGGEFLVNTFTPGFQGFYTKGIAADASGGFVVVWESSGKDGSSTGIFGQRFDGHGDPVDAEFQANTFTPGRQWLANVGGDREGNFLVVWRSNDFRNGFNSPWGQLYGPEGAPVGGEFEVNELTDYGSWISTPSVAADAQGTFVVAWGSYLYDYYTYTRSDRVWVRRFRVPDEDD